MNSQNFIYTQRGLNDGVIRHCSSIMKGGDGTIYSYGYHYPLLFKCNGTWWVNTTGYSSTTAKHISRAKPYATHSVKFYKACKLRDLAPTKKEVIDALKEERHNVALEMVKHRSGTKIRNRYNDRLIEINDALQDAKRTILALKD